MGLFFFFGATERGFEVARMYWFLGGRLVYVSTRPVTGLRRVVFSAHLLRICAEVAYVKIELKLGQFPK